MSIIFRWVLSAVGLIGIAYLVPGIGVETFYNALIAALVLGLVNALIRPIVLVLTLPVTIITLGFFAFVINAFMFWFVSTIVQGFHVEGFVPALLGAVLMWMVGLIADAIVKESSHT